MLTAVAIKNDKPQNRFIKLLNRIRGDKIITEIKSEGGVVLRDITYISRTGGVNHIRLAAAIGEARNILCDENTVLPNGYIRFENNDFKLRLSENLGGYLVSRLKEREPGLSVGFFDPRGNRFEAVETLCRYTDNLLVISDNREVYNSLSEKLLDETGAVFSFSESRQRLSDCRLIIAPEAICEPLAVAGDTVVLSGARPKVSLSCVCCFDYGLRMPNTFLGLKPERFTAEYFCGALYSLARRYELGSIVPTSCSDRTLSQTPASLLNRFESHPQKAYKQDVCC